jgi:hypothetical protein
VQYFAFRKVVMRFIEGDLKIQCFIQALWVGAYDTESKIWLLIVSAERGMPQVQLIRVLSALKDQSRRTDPAQR